MLILDSFFIILHQKLAKKCGQCEKMNKADFNQHLECAAPKRWLKFTTDIANFNCYLVSLLEFSLGSVPVYVKFIIFLIYFVAIILILLMLKIPSCCQSLRFSPEILSRLDIVLYTYAATLDLLPYNNVLS